jgi:hypothetical protein
MRKKKSHPVLDQFSSDEMEQIKRYGQALSGSPTSFDEEVEKHLRKLEANKKKMKAARTSGSGQAAAGDAVGG